jgi:murein peptide amidase A
VLEDLLREAARTLPLGEIGRSTEGRTIWAGRLGGPALADPAPHPLLPMLIVGGVHGDEPASVEAVLAFAAQLVSGPGGSAPVWVVPALNPDGLGRGTKNSARDVDLNRNFPARNFQTAHAPGYFPGAHPLSEPETRHLAELVERERIAAVVAVHAPFACVNYDGPAAAWAESVARACGWPARGDIGYPTPGSLGSWLGVDRALPVLTLELPPGPYAGFAAAAQAALAAAVQGALAPAIVRERSPKTTKGF